jgi:hypothetical protein
MLEQRCKVFRYTLWVVCECRKAWFSLHYPIISFLNTLLYLGQFISYIISPLAKHDIGILPAIYLKP